MRWTKHGGDSRPFTVVFRNDVTEITWTSSAVTPSTAAAWSVAERLSKLLHAAIADGATSIVVDLHDAGDATTALLAVLIDARSQARRARTRLILRGSPALLQLAEVCRLEAVLLLD